MTRAVGSVEIAVSATHAYSAWTRFMILPVGSYYGASRHAREPRARTTGSAERIGFDRCLTLVGRTSHGTQIVDVVPGWRVAWRALGGFAESGVVTFDAISDSSCLILVEFIYANAPLFLRMEAALGHLDRKLADDLQCFKRVTEVCARDAPERREMGPESRRPPRGRHRGSVRSRDATPTGSLLSRIRRLAHLGVARR